MSWDEAFNWAIKMHPNELQNMGWGWANPLPQNGQELKKAFKDGAVGAKENVKNTVSRAKEMHGESLNSIPRIPTFILKNPRLWPLLLAGSARIEYETKTKE